jgi:ABC-type microcin C transport system permease subunit YejB
VARYALRRLLLILPTLFLVTLFVFAIVRAISTLSLSVFGANILGDALRDLRDPRLRGNR